MRVPPLPAHERLLWEGHSSWADHAVLFILMGVALFRAALAAGAGEWLTAGLYVLAVGIFFGLAALFRYTTFYQISAQRVRITSGLRRLRTKEIQMDQIGHVAVRPQVLNGWFGLGAIEIIPRDEAGESLMLKGIPNPDEIKLQMDRLAGFRAAT